MSIETNGSGTLASSIVVKEENRLLKESAIRNVQNRLEVMRQISVSEDSFTELHYDIPTHLTEVPNPSGKLWRHGFRMNLSCWCLPSKEVDSQEVQDLMTYWSQFPEIDYYVFTYHPKEVEGIRKLAARKMEEELIRQSQSLMERMFAARESLDQKYKQLDERCQEGKEVSYIEYENADASYVSRMRGVLKSAEEDYEALVEGMKLFEEEGSTQLGISSLFNGLRALYRTQCLLHNASALEKNQPKKLVAVPEEFPEGVPVSHSLQRDGRTYTFFPLDGGEETVIVLTAPNKPKKGPGSEGEDGQLYGKSRQRVLTEEARKVYARLKREGWTPM